MMIIDPKEPRPQMTEFAMMMNAYDLDYDQEGPTMIRSVNDSRRIRKKKEKETTKSQIRL